MSRCKLDLTLDGIGLNGKGMTERIPNGIFHRKENFEETTKRDFERFAGSN